MVVEVGIVVIGASADLDIKRIYRSCFDSDRTSASAIFLERNESSQRT